jgi:hypothetical protein
VGSNGKAIGIGDLIPIERGGMLVAVKNDLDTQTGEKLADSAKIRETLKALQFLARVDRKELMVENGHEEVVLRNWVLAVEVGA